MLRANVRLHNVYTFEARDAAGNLKWREEVANLIPNVALDDILTQYYKGAGWTPSFFVGLKGAGAAAATDTMAAHATWTEVTAYSEGARQALVLGAVAAQSVSNTLSKATFSINGTITIAGGFIASSSVNAPGTAGMLNGVADFVAPRSLASGDTLTVTVTLTSASA